MPDWIIIAAPLLIAAVTLSLAFAGCSLDESGLAALNYTTSVSGTATLVSYWRLDEAMGATVAADSKDGNAGKYNGGVTLGVTGLLHGDSDPAAQLDGTSGYVSVPFAAALNPSPKFTLEMLVKIVGGDKTLRFVVSSAHIDAVTKARFGYGVLIDAGDHWVAFAGDGTSTTQTATLTGTTATAAGSPYYVALTYDGATMTLYVNPVTDPKGADVLGQVVVMPVTLSPNTKSELRIGAGNNDGLAQDFFNGVLDEVAIYNDALDFNTVSLHFAAMALAP